MEWSVEDSFSAMAKSKNTNSITTLSVLQWRRRSVQTMLRALVSALLQYERFFVEVLPTLKWGKHFDVYFGDAQSINTAMVCPQLCP